MSSIRLWLLGLGVLAVAGVVLVVLGGVAADIGYGVFGAVALLALCLGFYAVGKSEDRDRERDRHRQAPRRKTDRPG